MEDAGGGKARDLFCLVEEGVRDLFGSFGFKWSGGKKDLVWIFSAGWCEEIDLFCFVGVEESKMRDLFFGDFFFATGSKMRDPVCICCRSI